MTAPLPHLPLSPPRIVRGFDPLPEGFERPVIAIGNFDGVHRGHQAVIGAAHALARDLGRPAIVLTFEPHPRRFFAPAKPMFRITPVPLKAAVTVAFGVDAVIEFVFDAAFAGLTAAEFVDDVLITRYAASGVVVGHDFHFGKGREGSPAFLQHHAHRHDLPVVVVEPVLEADTPVSSSAIRDALVAGDIATANHLLGYRWLVQAEVVHGDARGRTLGYPTANMRLDAACGLRHGIYAVRVRVDGIMRAGVASFGRRPTFDDGAPLLETHLFDFSGDLYGKQPEVEFLAWLRPELKFDDVDALVVQMDRDSAGARAIAARPPDPRAPSLLG
ncbi:bifunctional riboflavin kinase/FAD synthetase [Pseudochelatococcus lubricantis]|uniref:bifunctional riboflavin kinase/FAD synthetase n=1 Tax=Pseudochelatococcus lubricantis TaxID=1538102 RepID=UPI0035EA8F05